MCIHREAYATCLRLCGRRARGAKEGGAKGGQGGEASSSKKKLAGAALKTSARPSECRPAMAVRQPGCAALRCLLARLRRLRCVRSRSRPRGPLAPPQTQPAARRGRPPILVWRLGDAASEAARRAADVSKRCDLPVRRRPAAPVSSAGRSRGHCFPRTHTAAAAPVVAAATSTNTRRADRQHCARLWSWPTCSWRFTKRTSGCRRSTTSARGLRGAALCDVSLGQSPAWQASVENAVRFERSNVIIVLRR